MSQAAVQLYTVRDFTRTMDDLARTLEAIRAIGYEAVQVSAVAALRDDHLAADAEAIRRLLDENGLRCIATHRSWDRLTQFTDAEIALHQALGCDFVAIGGAPWEYDADGVAGYRRFVADSAPTIARLKAAGIRFGHHNHQHEFRRDRAGRIVILQIVSYHREDMHHRAPVMRPTRVRSHARRTKSRRCRHRST